MGEAGFFVKRFAEARFDESERFGFGSGKKLEGERSEKFKRDHGGDGISRKSEDGFSITDAEDGGFARADGDGVEMKFGAEIPEGLLDEVILPGGNSAGENQHFLPEALRDFFAKVVFCVFRIDEDDGFAAVKRDLRSERVGVAVADLKVARFGFGRDDFVAGGKNRDARFAKNLEFDGADLRGDCDFRETDSGAAGEQHLAFGCFPAAWDDVLACGRGAIENDRVSFGARVFDHDNGVGALWDGGTRHDLNAGDGGNGKLRCVASFEFANAF